MGAIAVVVGWLRTCGLEEERISVDRHRDIPESPQDGTREKGMRTLRLVGR